jgi:hypothetical protein
MCTKVCACAKKLGCESLKDLLDTGRDLGCLTDSDRFSTVNSLVEPRSVSYMEWAEEAINGANGWLREAVREFAPALPNLQEGMALRIVVRRVDSSNEEAISMSSIAVRLIRRGYALPSARTMADVDSASEIMRAAWRSFARTLERMGVGGCWTGGAAGTANRPVAKLIDVWRLHEQAVELLGASIRRGDFSSGPLAAVQEVDRMRSTSHDRLVADVIGVPLFNAAWRSGDDDTLELLGKTRVATLLWERSFCKGGYHSLLQTMGPGLGRPRKRVHTAHTKEWVHEILRRVGVPHDVAEKLATLCVEGDCHKEHTHHAKKWRRLVVTSPPNESVSTL